jgi:hypothetical protein
MSPLGTTSRSTGAGGIKRAESRSKVALEIAFVGRLELHGGGWMWRPLVYVRDASDAMIVVLEGPAQLVKGEIFNVLHSNYQIRELAMLVAGSVQVLGRQVELVEAPAPRLNRNYECSNVKLSSRVGFIPSRSVALESSSIQDSVERLAEELLARGSPSPWQRGLTCKLKSRPWVDAAPSRSCLHPPSSLPPSEPSSGSVTSAPTAPALSSSRFRLLWGRDVRSSSPVPIG